MFLPMQLDALLRQSNGFQIWKVKKEIPGITKYRLVKISTFCKNWKNKVAAQLELCTHANHNSAFVHCLVIDNSPSSLYAFVLHNCRWNQPQKIDTEAPQMTVLELKGCGILSQATINCPRLLSLDASFCR